MIEIYKRSGATHEAVVLKSVLFPQIGGKYQNVSEEYVKAAIEKSKNGNNESVSTPITDAESLRIYLKNFPDNDAAAPYAVSVNVSDLSGIASALIYNKNKYVNLDLSGSTLTGIRNSAFSDCTSLTGITMPANVTSIGNSAFYSCTNLVSITIPSSVTSIGTGAFFSCDSLTSVTFEGTILSNNFDNTTGSWSAFFGDLRDKFYATNAINGTPGTYTTTAPVSESSVWVKQ